MDGNDSYTVSLLHMNGADSGITFIDSSERGTAKIWTPEGHAKTITTDQKFGSACAIFDGNNDDIISTPITSDFNFADGDWTIDLWFKRVGGVNANQYFGFWSNVGAGVGYLMMQIYTDNKFYLTGWDTLSASWQVAGTTAITDITTWHHIAWVRSTTTITEYMDGSSCGTYTIGTRIIYNNTLWNPTWGRLGSYGSASFNGKIDEARISIGIARWTANFTPPTEEYQRNPKHGFSNFQNPGII
jgi:hypothetical protein